MINNCKTLHETIVKDVIDVVSSVKDFDEIEWLRNTNRTGSIARRANNLVLVFPVIISSSLNIETAMIISKAIERKCVSLLQILFSSIQLTNADNMQDYLKQFHTNLNLNRMDLGEFMDVMDALVDEGSVEITDKDAYDAVREDMQNINYYLNESFNPTSINDYKVINRYGDPVVMQERTVSFGPNKKATGNEFGNPSNKSWAFDKDTKATGIEFGTNKSQVGQNSSQDKFKSHNMDIFHHGLKNPNNNINVYNNMPKNPNNINVNVSTGNNNIRTGVNGTNNSFKDYNEYFNRQLLDSDVKKANELVPTMMTVTFTTVSTDGKAVGQTTGVVGVKAKMYPVDSIDLVSRLTAKVKDKNGLFGLVRASTREISFFRDLVFAIDKAKLDAKNMASNNDNARMFKVLERRAAKNRFSSLMKKNDASPITSLVISQSEVEYMKQYSNIDMEKSHAARAVLEAYNLMDIVVADESLEIAKFLFDDGDGVYETLTFDTLEKQSNDNSTKKIINLLSRVNR